MYVYEGRALQKLIFADLLVPFNKAFYLCEKTAEVRGNVTVAFSRGGWPFSRIWSPYYRVSPGINSMQRKPRAPSTAEPHVQVRI